MEGTASLMRCTVELSGLDTPTAHDMQGGQVTSPATNRAIRRFAAKVRGAVLESCTQRLSGLMNSGASMKPEQSVSIISKS